MQFSSFLVPLLFLAILAGGLAWLKQAGGSRRSSGSSFAVQHVATKPLTSTEVKFMHVLVRAVPEAHVSPQMAMSALVDVAKHHTQGRTSRQQSVNRAAFAQKRLDYVLLAKEDMRVMAIVELDDHTHDSKARKEADAKRDALLTSLGYRVLRFDARQAVSTSTIRERLSLRS